jgi:hypothetical protein
LGESFFNGSQSSLQILDSCLGSSGFALFLLECRRLRPFARAFLFSSIACGDLFRYVRLRMRRNGGSFRAIHSM